MTILMATLVIDAVLQTVLVGTTFFALTAGMQWAQKPKRAVAVLLVTFAVLDLYWLPAIQAMNLTFTIGDPTIANFLGATPDMHAEELVQYGWVDAMIWILKSVVALWLGNRIARLKTSNQQSC